MRWTAGYPRFTAFGTSFAKGFGNQTVQGEVAYKPRFSSTGELRFSPGRSVAGRPRLGLRHRQQVLPELPAFRGRSGRLEASGNRTWHGATYEISGKWFRDALKTGVGANSTPAGGALTEVFLEYELDDHWKASTGVMFWTGREDTILGEYTDNDFVYLTLRYAF